MRLLAPDGKWVLQGANAILRIGVLGWQSGRRPGELLVIPRAAVVVRCALVLIQARATLDPGNHLGRQPRDAIGTDAAAWREPPALHVAIDRRPRQTGLQDDGFDIPQQFAGRLGTVVSAIVQRHHGSPSCVRPCERLSASEAGTSSAGRSSMKDGMER